MKKFDDLKRELSEGRISRREFLGRASAMGLLAAVPAAILSDETRRRRSTPT